MTKLSATETNKYLYSVTVCDKSLCVSYLCFKIVNINIKSQLDFLDFDNLLALFSLFLTLCLFKSEFAVIHNTTNRWNGIGSDFNKVEICFLGLFECLCCWHYANLIALFVNQSDFLISDLFID